MNNPNYFSAQIDELNNHAVQATVGILGYKNASLRKHLVNELKTQHFTQKNNQGLMGTPVFDVLFPWEGQDNNVEQLTPLLHTKTINVIKEDIAKPYKHQLKSWEKLSPSATNTYVKPQSLVVTSGTGSGKTECFMVPILDSLVRQYADTHQRLEGIQALFLYPLNALINSQRERLDKWTEPFDKNIQFCLYNGLTAENENETHTHPNQIESRKKLRESPPPILVTNATMLEYMLIRQKDQRIIEKSKGKLRWIVLDEAHSYLGSTASELSLLLRRVMLAFEVKAEDVHFIATSATIGEDKAEEERLKQFLADLSGVNRDNIHVITAKREVPNLPANPNNTNITTTPILSTMTQIEQDTAISSARFEQLSSHPFALQLRNAFLSPATDEQTGNTYYKTTQKDLSELTDLLKSSLTTMLMLEQQADSPFANLTPQAYLLKWIDICSFTLPQTDKPAFLPLRGHLFQRTLMGLYACCNPNCDGKHQGLDTIHNGIPDWQFGYIYANSRPHCDYCHYPVLELAFCQECQTPHLLAMQDKKQANKLVAFSRLQTDEFALDDLLEDGVDSDLTDPTTEEPTTLKQKPYLLAPVFASQQLNSSTSKANSGTKETITPPFEEQYISQTGELFSRSQADTIEIHIKEDSAGIDGLLNHCEFCESSHKEFGVIRTVNLGAPFYMSEAVSKLLDHCQPSLTDTDSLPYQGKRLITFTDSRQGTARITMKLRQDSELRALRHVVYNALSQGYQPPQQSADDIITTNREKIAKLTDQIARLKDMGDMEVTIEANEQKIQVLQKEIANAQNPIMPVITWEKMLESIQTDSEFQFLKKNISRVAKINQIDSDKAIAELLLLNEIAYRPKKANSLETLGLVYLHYPQLDNVTLSGESHKLWQELGFYDEDWRDFLKLLMDFYVREYRFLNLTQEQVDSVNTRFFARLELMKPNSEPDFSVVDGKRVRPWLQVNNQNPNRSQRLIKLLTLPKNLDLSDNIIKDKVNILLVEAFHTLTNTTLFRKGKRGEIDTYQLDFDNVSLTIPHQVYVCPVTQRFLDTTLQGYTPYLPSKQNLRTLQVHKSDYLCQTVTIPVFQHDSRQAGNSTTQAKAWLAENTSIQSLRAENLWTDISDAVIAGMRTIVTEEHSAQIEPEALQTYEAQFKQGKVNILNCSTTMEMGVDIGGISSVAMNNVPPHPANYLQRTGRAGRRGESHAIAFTLCKDNPHEDMVFNNTRWAFDTKIAPPYITLNSPKILQRHINAYLLGLFLNQQSTHADSNVMLKSGWFFLDWTFDRYQNFSITDAIKPYLEPSADLENAFSQGTAYVAMKTWLEELLSLDSKVTYKNNLNTHIQSLVKNSDSAHLSVNTFIKQSLEQLKNLKKFVIDKIINKLIEYREIKSPTNVATPYENKLKVDMVGIANSYLLADLARYGFLPRYGFPSGIVELDIYNTYSHARQANSNDRRYIRTDREENQSFANGKPVRDLAIALREYAPGNEVAVDGYIYRSAGLELSHYMSHSDSREAQVIHHFAQCAQCGAIDYAIDPNNAHCHSCGAQLPQLTPFIEPMGFKVDYKAKPHTKTGSKAYVPVQDPKIQANTPEINLPNPHIGSYRIDNEGKIFHHSRGTHGNGYFVCLHCGRAESVRYDKSLDPTQFDKQEKDFREKHIPLKPLKELKNITGDTAENFRGFCSNKGFKTHHIYIGATDTTNVFELYLKDPKTGRYFDHSDDSTTLLTTLAVALREALAQCNGINPDELGFGTKLLRIKDKQVHAIFIYDKASGGAGFASGAGKHLSQLFTIAKQILQCADNCESACHRCLLSYDTRFIADTLDRHQALTYLNDIEPLLNLPDEAKIITGAEYCLSDIAHRVAESFKRFDTLTLFLQGSPKEWAVANAISEKIANWHAQGFHIEIVLPHDSLNQLHDFDKLYLASTVNILKQVKLFTWQGGSNLDGNYLDNNYLLQMRSSTSKNSPVLTLATTDKTAYVPNESFWEVNDKAYIVESHQLPILPVEPLTLNLNGSLNNSIMFEIGEELNGILTTMGERFWAYLAKDGTQLARHLTVKTSITAITYSDTYLKNPQVLLVLGEIIYALKQHYDMDWNDPTVMIKTGMASNDFEPKQLKHNWKDSTTQKDVIKCYLEDLGFKVKTTIFKDKDSNIDHHRTLVINWADGSESFIHMDWGVGFWQYDDNTVEKNTVAFDFTLDAMGQSNRLLGFSKLKLPMVNRKSSTLISLKEDS